MERFEQMEDASGRSMNSSAEQEPIPETLTGVNHGHARRAAGRCGANTHSVLVFLSARASKVIHIVTHEIGDVNAPKRTKPALTGPALL
jgi:hypothetical protein